MQTELGRKARAEGLEIGHLSVFAHTNPHNGDPWYSGQLAARIEPTADSLVLIPEAVRLLRRIWRPGFRYSKSGVMLTDLTPAGRQKGFLATHDPARSARTMLALDTVNARFGRDTLRPASTGIARAWTTKRQQLSPRYTTHLSEILIGKAY
jgi:DNA polymerase V